MNFDRTKSMYEIVAETVWNHERRFRSTPSVLHFLGLDFETPGLISKLDNKKMPGSDQFRQGMKYPPYWAGLDQATVEPVASNTGLIQSRVRSQGRLSLLLNPVVPITKKVQTEVLDKFNVKFGELDVPGGGTTNQFAGIKIENKVLYKDIPAHERSTGQRIFFTQKEFMTKVNPMLTPQAGERTILFGHNVKFDLMHLRAMDGFHGIRNVSVLDSLTLFPAMFPELNLPSVGARKLDSIYELLTADPKRLKDTYRINAIPEELEIAYKAYQDSGLLPVGSSMHSPLKDINVSKLIIDAAIRLRGETSYGKKLLSTFLAKQGIIQGYMADMIEALDMQDPARLAGFMRQGKPKAAVTMLQGNAGLVFRGKKGVPELLKKLKSIYGGSFAGGAFDKYAKFLADQVGGDLTFVLRGNEAAGTLTNLTVGRWGDPTTFRALPLQSTSVLERSLLYKGEKTYTVDRIGFLTDQGIKHSDVATEYYKNALFELRRHKLTTVGNIEASLRIADKRAWAHPINMSREGSTFPLKELLGSSPYSSGDTSFERASQRGQLLTIARKTKFSRRTRRYGLAQAAGDEHPLMQAIDELHEARSDYNKMAGSYRNLGAGSSIAESLKESRAKIKEAEGKVFKHLQALGVSEAEIGKADYVLKAGGRQPLRIADPGSGDFYGLTPTERTRTKGRHQIRTGADLSKIQRLRLAGTGALNKPQIVSPDQWEALSSAHGPLARRLAAIGQQFMDNTITSRIMVMEFADELSSLHAIGDSAIRATARGMTKLAHHAPIGEVIIKNATARHLEALGSMFGPGVRQALDDLSGGLRVSPERAIPMRRARGGARKAFKYLMGALPSEESLVLREALNKNVGLTSLQFRGADIHLTLNQIKPVVANAVGVIAGEGPARMTVSGVVGGKIAKLLPRKTDFLMRSQDFKSLGIVDTLLTHQSTLVWKQAAQTYNRGAKSQSEALKLWKDYAQSIGADIQAKRGTLGTKPILIVKDRLSALKASEAFFDANKAGRLKKVYDMRRGIELDRKTLNAVKDEFSLSGISVGATAKTFFVGVKIRADQYLDANLKNQAGLSFRNIEMIGQGSGALGYGSRFDNPLFNLLNRRLGEQTGFRFGAQGLEVPQSYSAFASPLVGGKAPAGATVVKVRNGRFVIPQGELQNIPSSNIRGKGVDASLYENTILDPRLRQQGLYVELPKVENLPVGAGRSVRTNLINIPGEDILPIIQGNRVVLSGDSPAGRFVSALEGLRLAETDANLPVIPRVGGKVSPRVALGESISEIMTGWTGGEGDLVRRGTLKGRGFPARLVPKKSQFATTAQSVFEAEMSVDDLRRVIRRTFGTGRQARELAKKIEESTFRLPVVFRRNPPNRPESMNLIMITPVKGKRILSQAKKGRGAKILDYIGSLFSDIGTFASKPSIGIDPLLAEMLRGDFDLDVGTALDLMMSAKPEELAGLEEVYRRQIRAVGPQLNKFLREKSARPESIASLIDEALSKGMSPGDAEQFSAFLGQKSEAHTAFMIRKRVHNTVRPILALGEKNAPQLLRKLIGDRAASRDLTTPVKKFMGRLSTIGGGRHSASAIYDTFSTLYENPIQSTILKGEGKEIIHKIASAWATAASEPGATNIDAMRGIFAQFAELSKDQPKVGQLGTAGEVLTSIYGSASPEVMGQFMGDVSSAAIDMYKELGSPNIKTLEAMAESKQISPRDLDLLFRNLIGQDGTVLSDVASSTDGVLGGLFQGQKFNLQKVIDSFKNTIKTKPGLVAVGIAGIVGGYGLFRGMVGGAADNPPDLPVPLQGSPLPPAPALAQPSDSSRRRLPALRDIRLARVGMEHPHPIRRRGLSKNYQVSGFESSEGYANSIGIDINDNSSTINKHVIGSRMKEIANSDYTY